VFLKAQRRAIETPRTQPFKIRAWQHGAFFLFACAILFLRRPDGILHAQLYAEDGHVWLADAYNLGWWRALFELHCGYFQTFPRLGAAIALLVPLAFAPLVMNLLAIAAQALPVNLLLSSRSAEWGSFRFRALLAAVYLALPNCAEISFGITESQWLLALSAFLIVAASAPQNKAGKYFDIAILLISGLSGPYCILLFPIAVYLAWKRPHPWRWAPVCMMAACSLVQVFGLLILDRTGRPHSVLGASAAMFTRIFGGNVIVGTLLGPNKLATSPGSEAFIFLVVAAVFGVAVTAICFFRSVVEMRLFLVLSGLLLIAALVSPTTQPPAGSTVWEMLALAAGTRYWFFPTLAFAWSLLWCFRSRVDLFRIVSAPLLLILCFGIVRDWRRPAFKDMHFAEYAKRLDGAPAGTAVTIPENPDGWDLVLVKHPPGQ
jgi:hypothetical protein